MFTKQNIQQRIRLVAGAILIGVTLLVGITVFVVMQRHAEALLSKSLQLSLQSRVQLTETEIRAGFDRTVLISTRPLLTDQLQLVDARADDTAARNKLDMVALSFLRGGITAIALYGEDGQELTRVGVFAQQPELAVPLNLPGHVQLMWDGQLLLRAVVEMKKEGRVIGKVMTETSLPVSMGALKDANRLGKTGEMALCAPFGINMQCFPTALNPKIFTPPQRSPQGVRLPMTHAFEGETGFVIAKDYRHQEVVAAYAPVGDLGLGMVLKMDSAELHAPVWNQLRYLIPLLAGVLIIALLLLRWRLTPLVLRLVRSEAQARELSASLRDSEMMSRSITEGMAEGVITTTTEGIVLEANAAALQLFGYEKSELIGRDASELVPERHRRQYKDITAALAAQPEAFRIAGREVRSLRKDGSEFTASMTFSDVRVGGRRLFTVLVVDITERKQAVDRLNYLAKNDALTGLPNRVLFKERLEQAMIAAKGHAGLVAVVFLDLVRFKNVNDTLGHDAGDQMLIEVARRLLETVRSGDTVARMSGDEFTIVLADIGQVDDAARVAQKILHAFEPPFLIAGRELAMGASLGIAIFPLHTGDANELLSYADLAMYRAKEAGDNRYQFYTAEMTAQAADVLALENELRQGLERGEFFLNYQPIVDAGGNIVGAEALLRWQHGRRGLIPPARFISLAETTGLILPIGEWVLRQACVQAMAWRKPNGALLRMTVNVSPRQFRHGDLAKTIATILAETGLAPSALDLEITEGVLMQGETLAQEVFYQLSELGLSFAIDDFGTGFSNFAYLKRFPINSLKIDQSFIRDLITDPNDAAIVKAIIGMAHSLGIKTTAEGVETLEQKEFLLAYGCDLMQGYYFSYPLPPEAFTALLDAGKPLLGNDP